MNFIGTDYEVVEYPNICRDAKDNLSYLIPSVQFPLLVGCIFGKPLPTIGKEIQKIRPAVVVSPDEINAQ